MGCALFSMPKSRNISRTLLTTWAALSLSFVNGTSIMSNAGYCSLNEFWYEPIQDCLPLGKQSFQSAPPDGIACPSEGSWYWSSQLSVCLPTSPEPDVLPLDSVSCPVHYTWDAATSRCILVGYIQHPSACGTTEFWFSEKATCLPRRDPTPASTRCPLGWYWCTELASCAPADPEALLSQTCWDDYVWSPSTLMCQRVAPPSRRSPSSAPSRRPSPSPSPGQLLRRHQPKSRTVSLCPAGLDACPILNAGDLSDYECVDPKYDLQHCGGCSVDGRGEDCTSIEGVWNVECVRTHCSVLTCRVGYIPSIDRRTCVKL